MFKRSYLLVATILTSMLLLTGCTTSIAQSQDRLYGNRAEVTDTPEPTPVPTPTEIVEEEVVPNYDEMSIIERQTNYDKDDDIIGTTDTNEFDYISLEVTNAKNIYIISAKPKITEFVLSNGLTCDEFIKYCENILIDQDRFYNKKLSKQEDFNEEDLLPDSAVTYNTVYTIASCLIGTDSKDEAQIRDFIKQATILSYWPSTNMIVYQSLYDASENKYYFFLTDGSNSHVIEYYITNECDIVIDGESYTETFLSKYNEF